MLPLVGEGLLDGLSEEILPCYFDIEDVASINVPNSAGSVEGESSFQTVHYLLLAVNGRAVGHHRPMPVLVLHHQSVLVASHYSTPVLIDIVSTSEVSSKPSGSFSSINAFCAGSNLEIWNASVTLIALVNPLD